MKSHIGVDAGSGYVYSMETTAANHQDITATAKLIYKDDTVVLCSNVSHEANCYEVPDS